LDDADGGGFMKIESPELTLDDFKGFLDDLLEYDRDHLIFRLRGALAQLDELLPKISSGPSSDGDGWGAPEVLAHISVFTGFFGWLAYTIAKGRPVEVDLIEALKQRDLVGSQAAELPPAEMAETIRSNMERTISFLEKATPDELRNEIDYLARRMRADDIVRISLCAHLETHLRQMRDALT
jgi:hypothetical protein